MAIKTIKNDVEMYIRSEFPRVYGKFIVQFDCVEYIHHPISGEMVQVGKETMNCSYALDGPNIFEQCYAHAKETLPYDTVDC